MPQRRKCRKSLNASCPTCRVITCVQCSLNMVPVPRRPHIGTPSAFIYATVLEGEIRSKVNDEPEHVYKAGESWTEMPGGHHKVSANASSTKPARLLAIFVVDTTEQEIVIPDK
jgi:Cupin domain